MNMNDNIEHFPILKDDLTVEEVLAYAHRFKEEYDEMIIIGTTKNKELLISGTTNNTANTNLLLDLGKQFLMLAAKQDGAFGNILDE